MVLGTIDGYATAMMIKDEWTIIHYMIIKDIMWVIINISRIDLEATVMIIWIAWDFDMHEAHLHPKFEVVIHMSEATLIDSSEVTFSDCTWRGRVDVLRTILCYPKAILANIRTTIQRF